MSLFIPPWENSLQPNQGNVRQWLDNLYSKFQPIEQSRWNQANIDTQFYAGAQSFVNNHFNFTTTTQNQQYYFNICQQPVNMITGHQRQHRKSVITAPTEGSDPFTTDQYSQILVRSFNDNGIHEEFSKGCELAAVSGMVLGQPYLDYRDDPAQGDIKLKIWEYNSFLVDPFFRNPDMSDCSYIWCQEYISKHESEMRFPDKKNMVSSMSASAQSYGNFYFLPENHNMSRNDLLVLSYVWYRWKVPKKKLYSRTTNMFYDISDSSPVDSILASIPDLEVVTVQTDAWKLALVLNDQLMFQGENPLGFTQCPFVPIYWNYEPWNNIPDLRVRSLIRPMRPAQFLFNYKVINNNDIAAASINAGWIRKSGAVANEDNLKKSGQGWDIIINDGYELADCQKIIPSAVPQSDIELAQQMYNLIFQTSGIDLENWASQQDKQVSALTTMIRMSANLMVFQKYFDQWDQSLKLIGNVCLQIALNNWNEFKVRLFTGTEPTAFFFSKIFAKYKIAVEEGLLTPTQKNYQAQQMIDINMQFGREVFPPSMIIKDMNLQGKGEMMEYLQNQEQQAQAMQQEASIMEQTFQQAKLQELMSKATANIAMAKERYGRFESNIGLMEERISEISKNRSLAVESKMKAITEMLNAIEKFGELETRLSQNNVENMSNIEKNVGDTEKTEAHREQISNEFLSKLMNQGVA